MDVSWACLVPSWACLGPSESRRGPPLAPSGHVGPKTGLNRPPKNHQVHPALFLCKDFVAPRRAQDTPGGAPKTTRCILNCFVRGICSPKTTPRRPKATLYCFLQTFWGASWVISGLSWSIVDLSWAMLGHLGPVLGLSSACLGPVFGHRRPNWGCPGTSWACFGLLWGCVRLSWAVLGLSYQLKLFWKA